MKSPKVVFNTSMLWKSSVKDIEKSFFQTLLTSDIFTEAQKDNLFDG